MIRRQGVCGRRWATAKMIVRSVTILCMSATLCSAGMWIDDDVLSQLPVSGPAWENLLREANQPVDRPDLSDQDDRSNVRVMAKALAYARTGTPFYRDEVIRACMDVIGTEGGRTLALGRELMAYVLAADLVRLPSAEDARFRTWLETLPERTFGGRTLISTHEDRPNNWGTHAGASRLAVAIYLGDTAEIERSARVFRGWLGERDQYAGFKFGDLAWQCDGSRPVGIGPVNCFRNGVRLDGALPEELRRSGAFAWPPPKQNYIYEALQGALAQAVLFERLGYRPFTWGTFALVRAYAWLYHEARFPAEGDDRWQIHLVNHFYGTRFPVEATTTPGKNVGWTEWTHGSRSRWPR